MFLHIGPFLPLRSSHWMLLHVLSLLLLLVRPSCYFSTTFYITCQGEHSKWKKFFSCCCGKCAPKKPEEDEDAPDLGDLTAEEETEVTKSAWKYKLLHKIGIEKVLMYLNVIRSPFYYTWVNYADSDFDALVAPCLTVNPRINVSAVTYCLQRYWVRGSLIWLPNPLFELFPELLLAGQLGGWPTELLPLLRRTSTRSCQVHLVHFRKESGGD